MFLCRKQPIYSNQLLSPPPQNNKNTLDEQWHNLIRFILCLAEYIRHCSAHWSWTEPLGERLLSHINQMDSRLVKSLSVFTCGDRKHCTRLHTVHRYLQVTHVCAYMSATHTRTSERGSTHPVRHTRITLCRWRTGFTWSDGAFSTGLELTDAQADYSGSLVTWPEGLHARPRQWGRSSSAVLFRLNLKW